jgi:hypothetical protein
MDLMYTIGLVQFEYKRFLRVLELAGKRIEKKKKDSK